MFTFYNFPDLTSLDNLRFLHFAIDQPFLLFVLLNIYQYLPTVWTVYRLQTRKMGLASRVKVFALVLAFTFVLWSLGQE